ncbi:MAG: RNA methyltransferase [Rhodocyclales bacterium]|nr:RNA methyltransferase [Rhodocyclales bacterium]
MSGTKTITSRDNPTFKALRLLAKDTREQERQGRTVVDGLHLVAEYRQRVGAPELLVVSESGERNAEVQELLARHQGVEILRLRDSLFGEISGVSSAVGLLARIAIPPAPTEALTESCILLDAVQDAGNVGTIMRTAAAAGVRDVVLGPGCAGAWSPRVLRAAQGAHFGLRIRPAADLAQVVARYGQLSVAAVAAGGTSLYDADLSGPVAWIFGNEGTGVAAELAALATARITIPMAGGSESLNVAAAAAVCLFEAVRQRRQTSR